MRRECRERFLPPPISKETASKRSWHASRHVRHARAVMHVEIAYLRWRGKRSRHSRRMRTRNIAYLVRGPWAKLPWGKDSTLSARNSMACHPDNHFGHTILEPYFPMSYRDMGKWQGIRILVQTMTCPIIRTWGRLSQIPPWKIQSNR